MNFWYNFNDIRSKNCMFNFILSNRGGGKTYGAKLLGIKSFLKKGEQFAYVRRYWSEFDTINTFFDDIVKGEEFPDHEFKVQGNVGYCDGQPMVYFLPLSVSLKYKSTPMPNVTKIFFDEFIIDKANSRYLKGEVQIFLDLVETINRLRTGKNDNLEAFFLANNVSLVNPYFSFFGLSIDPNSRITKFKDKEIAVELWASEDFIKEKEKTRFFRVIKGTDYADYNVYNKSLKDNSAFIRKRPSGRLSFISSFVIEGIEIGLWFSEEENIWFFDKKVDKDSKRRFTITKEDHTPQYTNIEAVKNSPLIKQARNSFNQNNLFFSSQEVKQLYFDLLKYI